MTSTNLLRSRVKVTFHARFCRPVGWVTALLSLTPLLLTPLCSLSSTGKIQLKKLTFKNFPVNNGEEDAPDLKGLTWARQLVNSLRNYWYQEGCKGSVQE